MKPILKVLTRCLAVEFYKQNAAFFGLILLILFGFIKASEHLAIGSFLIANPSSLIFLYLLWIAYGIKIMFFITPAIHKKENLFLEVFLLLPIGSKLISTTLISALLMLPIIAYAVFLISLAVSHGLYWPIVSIVAFMIFVSAGLSFFVLKMLSNITSERHTFQIRFFKKLAMPQWLFFIAYLIRSDPALLILSKIYSCLVIIGVSALYSTDQFDLRVLATGILLSFVGNTAILHRLIWFEYQKMRFSQNVPQSFFSYLLIHFLTFFLLLIPENIVLARYYPLPPHIEDVAGIFLFGFGLNVLIFAMLMLRQIELSDFIIRVFWLIVMSTFLILFSIHPLLLASMYIFIASAILYFCRYRFEFVEKLQ